MLTIEPRLRAATKKHRGSRTVVDDLLAKLSSLYAKLTETKKQQQDIERELRWCDGHLKFQQRTVVSEYQGQFKLFEIEDGETHLVAATSKDGALQYYAVDVSGYESVDAYRKDMISVEVTEQESDTPIPVYDIDDTRELVVKTAAEWADTDSHCVVSTTAY